MRLLVLIAGLALAMAAMADDKHKVTSVTKELDKSSPQLISTDDSTTTTEAAPSELHAESVVHRDVATRATDYNSSRSNRTTAKLDADDDGDSISTEDACDNAVDQDCTGNTDDPVVRKKPGKK